MALFSRFLHGLYIMKQVKYSKAFVYVLKRAVKIFTEENKV